MGETCYVAIWPCGCALATCVNKPEYAKENAKSVSAWMKQGATIELWPIERIRSDFPRRIPDCVKHAKRDKQMTL